MYFPNAPRMFNSIDIYLSYGIASGSAIRLCNIIDKPSGYMFNNIG